MNHQQQIFQTQIAHALAVEREEGVRLTVVQIMRRCGCGYVRAEQILDILNKREKEAIS